MKNVIRIISLVLVLVMLASAMTSCFLFGGDNTTDDGNNSGNNDNNGGNETPDDGNETPDDGGNEDPDNGGNSGAQDYTTIFTGKQSVLLIGQSNMAGRGFAEDVEPISDDRITMLNQSNEWVKMQQTCQSE